MTQWSRGAYFAMMHYKKKADKLNLEHNKCFTALVKIANCTKVPQEIAREALQAPVKINSKRIKSDARQLRLL